MILVIDSNIIVPEYDLEGTRTGILFRTLPSTNLQLFVPQLIIDEVAATVARRLRDTNSEVRKALSRDRYSRLPVQPFIALSEEQIELEFTKFRDGLTQKLRSRGAHITDYPEVTHDTLVRRIARGRRPFLADKDDEGYRDALIWEAVLEIAESMSDDVVFVTSDKFAFGERKNGDWELHPHMADDIRRRGLDGRLRVYLSFDEFAADCLAVSDEIDPIRELLARDVTESGPVVKAIAAITEATLTNWELPPGITMVSAHVMAAVIRKVRSIGRVNVERVVKIGAHEYLAQMSVAVTCELDLHVMVGGSWAPGETRPFGGQEYSSREVGGFTAIVEADLQGGSGTLSVVNGEVTDVAYTGPLSRILSEEEERQRAESIERYDRARREHAASVINSIAEFGGRTHIDEVYNSGLHRMETVILASWPGIRMAILPAYAGGDVPYYHFVMRDEYYGSPLRAYTGGGDFAYEKVVVSDEWTASGATTDEYYLTLEEFRAFLDDTINRVP